MLWEKYVACIRCIVQLALKPDISNYFPTIPDTDTLPDFTEITFNFECNNKVWKHLEIADNCYLHPDNNLSVIFAKIILLKYFYDIRYIIKNKRYLIYLNNLLIFLEKKK